MDEFLGPKLGFVTARNDPLKRGRVRVQVPGLIEPESNWCWPRGNPGGGKLGFGMHLVPQVGAQVIVEFLNADPDLPMYEPGPWPTADEEGMPSGATTDVAASDHPEQVGAIETEAWRVALSDETGKQYFRLVHKPSGNSLEWDAATKELVVTMETRVRVVVDGEIDLRATRVRINDRVVQAIPDAL